MLQTGPQMPLASSQTPPGRLETPQALKFFWPAFGPLRLALSPLKLANRPLRLAFRLALVPFRLAFGLIEGQNFSLFNKTSTTLLLFKTL